MHHDIRFLYQEQSPRYLYALFAMDRGFMGPNYSIAIARGISNYCSYAATNHIHYDEVDLMIASGTNNSNRYRMFYFM